MRASILLLIAGALILWAQETRAVRGTVTDQTGHPVRGAVVQIKDLWSLQIRSYITQSDGKYRFGRLSGDVTYELHATYHGSDSSTKTLSKFDSDDVATINLSIEDLPRVFRSKTNTPSGARDR
jgi:hypothetical protein